MEEMEREEAAAWDDDEKAGARKITGKKNT